MQHSGYDSGVACIPTYPPGLVGLREDLIIYKASDHNGVRAPEGHEDVFFWTYTLD